MKINKYNWSKSHGALLQKLRKERKIKLKQLAKELGAKSRQFAYLLTSGRYQYISSERLDQLCELLNVPLETFTNLD
jgi:transcriptional regulator with XRE-family HTH domain